MYGHGRRFCFELNDETVNKLLKGDSPASREGVALSIFEDGSIMLSSNVYDSAEEDYREYALKVYEAEEKDDMIAAIDSMLCIEPFWVGGRPDVKCYEDMLRLFKEGK